MSRGRSRRGRAPLSRPEPSAASAAPRFNLTSESVWWLVWACFAWPICFRPLASSDSWWHIHWGRWWWHHFRAPDFAGFYFTPVRAQVEDFRSTVLGDITLYLVHALAGTFGLHLLIFFSLAAAVYLLRALTPGKLGPGLVLVLMVLAVATRQLQIPRNALISLPGTALCFCWLHAWQRERRLRSLWSLCPMLAFWSGFHGSALLGWLLCALFLAGDAIDCWRNSGPVFRGGARLPHAMAMLTLSLCLICAGNATAMQFIRYPYGRLHAALVPRKAAPLTAAAPIAGASPGTFQASGSGLAGWLNGLVWRAGPGGVRSVEFDSPFVHWRQSLVLAAFLLIGVGSVAAFGTRPIRLAWLFPFALTTFMALCYIRFVGYGALGASALLFAYGRMPERWAPFWRNLGPVGAALARISAAACFVAYLVGESFGLWQARGHMEDYGRAAVFANAPYDWVLREYPARRVFTTIVTGSYALFRWDGRLPVFIDGFFAPHPDSVWADYRRVRLENNPELLTARYGAEVAMVENDRPEWVTLFLGSPKWRPVAISGGCLILARAEQVPPGRPPALLLNEDAARDLPEEAQRALAIVYGGTMRALAAHRDLPAAAAFEAADPGLSAFLHSRLASHPQ